jgi:hypothetical protein
MFMRFRTLVCYDIHGPIIEGQTWRATAEVLLVGRLQGHAEFYVVFLNFNSSGVKVRNPKPLILTRLHDNGGC